MPAPMPSRGPLWLRSLEIENFRSIDQLKLLLTDRTGQPLDTVVLAGDNGCGKTSVLEALLLLLGQQKLLPDDAAPLAEQHRFGTDSFHLSGTLAIENAPGSYETVSISTPEYTMLMTPKKTAALWEGGFAEVANGVFWQQIERIAPQVEYFSARREPESLGETPQARGARSAREARRIVELKRRMRNAFNRAARLSRTGRIPSNIPAIEKIQKVWNYLYGDSELIDIIDASGNEGEDEELVLREAGKPLPPDITSLAMARQLASTRPDIPRMVPLDRLSSGQVALFAFAGPLVFRDVPPDIVIIDEPEQHMHGQWQRILVGLLRLLAPQAQLILATHSEAILRSVPSYQRFLLIRDNDRRVPTLHPAPEEE